MLVKKGVVLERKADRELPEVSRLQFSEKILASNFVLLYALDKAIGLLSRRGRADLTLLRKPFVIR